MSNSDKASKKEV
jgi:hypothetical protein